jgi:hypothetical protein
VTHPWHPIPGGVIAPAGFMAAGITAGLKPSGNPDLALLLAPELRNVFRMSAEGFEDPLQRAFARVCVSWLCLIPDPQVFDCVPEVVCGRLGAEHLLLTIKMLTGLLYI